MSFSVCRYLELRFMCVYIYIYTHKYTYVPTYLPTYLPTYIHTYIHTLMYIETYHDLQTRSNTQKPALETRRFGTNPTAPKLGPE